MADVGILRFDITDQIAGRGAWRFTDSRKLWDTSAQLYRDIYERAGMPLLPGYRTIRCTKEDFAAKYDYELGIDAILTLQNGMEKTLQEKFLFTWFGTVTIEYYQNWRTKEPGDWFNIKAQNYFVGYDYPKTGQRLTHWIMLNWPCVTDATARGEIPWQNNRNTRDGARASFRFAHFGDFPDHCITDRHWHPGSPVEQWRGTCSVCGDPILIGGYNKEWNKKKTLRRIPNAPHVPTRPSVCLTCKG